MSDWWIEFVIGCFSSLLFGVVCFSVGYNRGKKALHRVPVEYRFTSKLRGKELEHALGALWAALDDLGVESDAGGTLSDGDTTLRLGV